MMRFIKSVPLRKKRNPDFFIKEEIRVFGAANWELIVNAKDMDMLTCPFPQ
ncbi:MAG TPA: hypothetical protein PKD52_03500 [Clostridiales bacterium]|nr:hypothetical protein [Clostridiales bacterium]